MITQHFLEQRTSIINNITALYDKWCLDNDGNRDDFVIYAEKELLDSNMHYWTMWLTEWLDSFPLGAYEKYDTPKWMK